MRYIVDHDWHIHSKVSSCSKDPQQSNENILQYAKDNGLKTICIADHFWDERVEGASEWYAPQNYNHVISAKPNWISSAPWGYQKKDLIPLISS